MTTGQPPLLDRPRHAGVVVAITALRATLAYGIGLALLSFGQGEEAVIGFMGLYWLLSGLDIASSDKPPWFAPMPWLPATP